MTREVISTSNAPAAIGPYSQAIRTGSTVYLSGQIPLDPETGHLVPGGFDDQVHRAFKNLREVAQAAGGSLGECVKLTLFLTDLSKFPQVNTIMQEYFQAPFPARSTVEVSGLPREAQFEVEAVMVLG
jgi:reactive intermediate/imine deaminase